MLSISSRKIGSSVFICKDKNEPVLNEEVQKNNIIINNKYNSINTRIRKLEDELSQKSRRKKDGSLYYNPLGPFGKGKSNLKKIDEEITRLYAKKMKM